MRAILVAIALVAGLAPASRARAGAAVASVTQVDLPNGKDMALTAVTVTYAPGQGSMPHRHGGFVMAYVLKGTIVTQVEGEAEKTLGPGQSWTEAPGAHHIVCRNPSRTEPAEFLAVIVAPKGAEVSTADGAR